MNTVSCTMSIWNKITGLNKINDIESLQKNKTFCVMPWVHFHVTQHGTVTPCCQAPWQEEQAFGNINKQSIEEIWYGDKLNSFRKGMLNDVVDKRCEACFVKEREGFMSLRKITNKKYSHKHPLVLSTSKKGEIKNAPPVYFDIRFSNVCNLRCRICGPWSSSGWYNDAVKLGMLNRQQQAITYSLKEKDDFFVQFKKMIPSLEELYFAGGEPLVTEEHYTVLQLLIDAGRTDVKLTYNTNFSSFLYKDYNIFELWKKFSSISLAASLDAEEKRGEFLRKNIRWAEVLENRKRMLNELSHIEFMVSPTVNTYNLLHLPDFHTNWVNNKLIEVEDFIPTLLIQPEALSVSILPRTFKNKAIGRYELHLIWIKEQTFKNTEKRDYMIEQFENIIKCLNVPDTGKDIELFRKSSRAMDAVRTEKTQDVFPELVELF